MGLYLQKKYGESITEQMRMKSKNKFHLERFILKHLIGEYTLKVSIRKNELGIK